MSSIKWNDTHITIEYGKDKAKDIQGSVRIPHAAIYKVTVDNGELRLHVRGLKQLAPSFTGAKHNRYSVVYATQARANEVKSNVDRTIKYYGHGLGTLGTWKPVPHTDKASALIEKKGTYTSWVNNKARKYEQKQADAARAQRAAEHKAKVDAERGHSEPAWYDKSVAKFGDIRVNRNATVTFNGDTYSIKGARAGVDMDMANNKKFGKGRLVMGAAAFPVAGLLAAPALIRKQKGIITLEVALADGTCLVTVGNSGHGGKSDAIDVVKQITKQAA